MSHSLSIYGLCIHIKTKYTLSLYSPLCFFVERSEHNKTFLCCKHFVFDYSPDKQKNARLSRSFFCGSRSDCSRYFTAMKMYELSQITATLYTKKSTPQLVFAKFFNMSEESMENFQGIHASVITALRCSKTRVWNSAGPQIFSRTPELHTRNSAGLRTLDWNAITWQNFQTRNSTGLQNSNPGICRTPELRTWNPPESGIPRPQLPGIPVDSGRNPNWTWNSAGIPLEFRAYFLLGSGIRLKHLRLWIDACRQCLLTRSKQCS